MAYADALREYEHKRQLGQARAADYDAITNAYNQEYDRYRGQLKLWRVRHYAWEKGLKAGSEPLRPVEPQAPTAPNPNEVSAMSERRFTISHDVPPDRYELSVAWNEAEFVNQGEVGFSVSAAKHLLGDDGQVIEQDVATGQLSVAVRQDPEFTDTAEFRPLLVITFPRREEPFTFPLHDLHDEAMVLDEIPAELFGLGDPIVGCLVRAGLSAVVGQVIQCTRSTTDTVSGFVARMREIGHCLVDNIAGMSARMAGLAMRCIVRAF